MNDLDQRRRRAAYRAHHRGTKEMDWLVGRYADSRLAAMTEPDLAQFEVLLGLPDPDVQTWLMTGAAGGPSELEGLIGRIREFHGLGTKPGASSSC